MSPSPNSQSLSKQVFEEAWISLLGFYGRAFESQYGTINGEQFNLWYAGLTHNAVTDEMVAVAIRTISAEHARRTSHAPNYADLLRHCIGVTGDAVNEDRGFAEASAAARAWDRHTWSSQAIYHAAIVVGAWSLRHLPEKVTRPRFAEAYRKVLEQERAGEPLAPAPAPVAAAAQLPAPAPANSATVSERRRRQAALSKALLELPENLQRLATEALKTGKHLSPDAFLARGGAISPASRAVLLQYCCGVTVDQIPQSDDSPFNTPSI